MPEIDSVPKVRKPAELLVRFTPSLPPLLHGVFPKLTLAVVVLTVIQPVVKPEIVVEPRLIEPVTPVRVSPCPVLPVEATLVNDPDKAPPLMFSVRPFPLSV